MAYLFCAFAVVWVGVFAYLYGLVQRSRRLEREIAALADRSGGAGAPAANETRDGLRR